MEDLGRSEMEWVATAETTLESEKRIIEARSFIENRSPCFPLDERSNLFQSETR